MSSADLTRRALSLGARDLVHGLSSKVFTESTISGSIQNSGNSRLSLALGVYAKYPHTAFIPDVIRFGDELKDAQGQYYVVNSAEQLWRLNEFIGYVCNCQKLDAHSDREATSGTWHVDSDTLKTDSRYRHKTYFETYITGAAIPHLDDGGTAASIIYMFSGADYPLLYELLPGGNDVDLIVTIDKSSLTSKWDYQHKPYAYEESVPITLWSINKAGLTAVRLIDEMEEAIKKVVTDHPIGSIRKISRVDNKPVDLDGQTLYSSTVTVQYTRTNDDYSNSGVTVTWGPHAAPTGTYTIPNIIRRNLQTTTNMARLSPPRRIGNILQKLGMPDFIFTFTCDTQMENSTLTWKRPQTTLPKTDVVPWQVFWDIQFNGQLTEAYQTMNLGWGGTVQVVLADVDVPQDGERNELNLTFWGYSSSSGTAYKTWFGINP